MKKITIGISAPCYNEYHNIDIFFKNILKLNNKFNVRLCIVDDSSTDGTLDKINLYKKKYKFITLIKRQKIIGQTQVYSAYHLGLKTLLKDSSIKYFLQLDTDNVCSLKNIFEGLNKIVHNPNIGCVKLTKYFSNSKITRSLLRSFLSRIYTSVCKFFFNSNITDYSTGIRFYNRKTLSLLVSRKIIFTSPIGLLDDLLFLIKRKINIHEVPFSFQDRKYGKSFFGWKVAFIMCLQFTQCIIRNL